MLITVPLRSHARLHSSSAAPHRIFTIKSSMGGGVAMQIKLSDQLYDVLRWVVALVLPALATLYVALATVWGWPYPQETATTITAVDTFLGAILCIGTNYSTSGKKKKDSDPTV